MTTEERLSKLETRVQIVEELVQTAQAKLEAFAASPAAKKIASMFGVQLT
jgi:hypothetical protein